MFHDEKLGTAALVTAQGLGAVCMALSLATLFAQFGIRRVTLGILATLPVALLAYAVAPALPLAVVAIFVVGFLYLGSLSSFTTIAQLRAPAALRGRVVSVLMMLIGALYPIGSVVQGAIADEVGLRATTAGAAVLLAVLLLMWRLLRPQAADALGDSVTTAIAPAFDAVQPTTGETVRLSDAPVARHIPLPDRRTGARAGPRCDRGSNCS